MATATTPTSIGTPAEQLEGLVLNNGWMEVQFTHYRQCTHPVGSGTGSRCAVGTKPPITACTALGTYHFLTPAVAMNNYRP
jgi:hypothetical protein